VTMGEGRGWGVVVEGWRDLGGRGVPKHP